MKKMRSCIVAGICILLFCFSVDTEAVQAREKEQTIEVILREEQVSEEQIILLIEENPKLYLSSTSNTNVGKSGETYSGNCGKYGDNILWNLSEQGVLTLEGSGEMADYYSWPANVKTATKKIIVKKGITALGKSAFQLFPNVETAELPEGMRQTSGSVFFYCISLREVKLPSTITRIEAFSFAMCPELTTVDLPSKLKEIGKDAFLKDTGITKIKIPLSLETIEQEAFKGCSGLKSISLPRGIREIETEAFGVDVDAVTKKLIPRDNFVVYGYIGSAAEQYSMKNKLHFVSRGYADRYTVELNANGGTVSETIAYVGIGSTYGRFPVASHKQWIFDGWYTALEGGIQIAEGAVCNQDITLYAHWREKIKAPQPVSAIPVAGGMKISWKRAEETNRYTLFRKEADGGWIKIGNTASTSLVDRTGVNGHSYYYAVRCLSDDGRYYLSGLSSEWMNTVYKKYLETPLLISAENTQTGVKLRWTQVSGAQNYAVYRKTGEGNWHRLKALTGTEYLDTSAENNETYLYTIRCISKDGRSFTSDYNREGWEVICKR